MKKEYRPRLTEDEYELIKNYRGIKDSADELDICDKDVKHGWLKSKTASLFFNNPSFQEPDFDPNKIDWENIISNVNQKIKVKKPVCFKEIPCIFDRLVYTDTHIGMKILEYSQYGGTWNYSVIMSRLKKMIAYAIEHQKSNTIVVDDLGDFMDGFNAKTVRRQHDLPQNMTDQQAFDCGLEFKLLLAKELSSNYNKVIFHNICNDNHAGAFGYMVNSAFAMAVSKMLDNVDVVNYNKFINHYEIDDNIFIICHGKDGKNMKFGFKPHVSERGIEKINNYIDINYLMRKGVRIEFSKGDSHVELKDKAKPSRFEYWNYPAFCPASDWVQTNYTPKDSGFIFFNYYNTNRYTINPFYFER